MGREVEDIFRCIQDGIKDRCVDRLREHTQRARRLCYAIDSARFKWIWDRADSIQRAEILSIIHSFDEEGLNSLLKSIINYKTYGEMSIRELRQVAHIAGIPSYSTRNKLDLVEALECYDKKRDVRRDTTSCSRDASSND